MASQSSEDVLNFERSFDKHGVPQVLDWSVEKVGEWISSELNLPQYRNCFITNFVNGRTLILMDASVMPKIGITDFQHILKICQTIRGLLGIEEPFWNRSIQLAPRDTVAHFLERKSETGIEIDMLTFDDHMRYLKKFYEHK